MGMDITRNKEQCVMKISQRRYLERILERFGMKNVKAVMTPIAQHFKLSSKQCPETEGEIQTMNKSHMLELLVV